MIRSFLAIIAASAAVATAAAQPAPEAGRIRAHMAFLADDRLEGREAGTRGHEIAALYVAQQLAALGFVGAAENGSFYQPVPLHERSWGEGGATLTIAGRAGSRTFRNTEQVGLLPSLTEAEETLTAPVVFVGYGLTAPQLKHDDYAGLDVRGKIVAVMSGFPKDWPSDVAAHLNGEKAKMAEAAGAVAMITLRRPTEERIRTWERVRARYAEPRMTWIGRDGKPFTDAPAIRASATVSDEAAQTLFAGAPRSFAAVQAEAEAGRSPKGFPLATTATIKRSSRFRTVTSPNVVGILPGSDPRLRDEVVVLMAHLDHLGIRPALPGPDKIYNGAMDNATGIAIMLEVARALAGGKRPKRSIMVFATTAEEKGLLGAEYFAAYPPVPAGRIAAAINMDMPILTYDFGEAIGFGAEHTTLGRVAEAAARAEGIKLAPDPQPEQRFFTRSDHYPLVKVGIPAIYLDVGEGDRAGGRSGKPATDLFLQQHYHEPSDELDLPINYDAAARLARINATMATSIANDPARPRWLRGSFFGETFAPNAPKAAP